MESGVRGDDDWSSLLRRPCKREAARMLRNATWLQVDLKGTGAKPARTIGTGAQSGRNCRVRVTRRPLHRWVVRLLLALELLDLVWLSKRLLGVNAKGLAEACRQRH